MTLALPLTGAQEQQLETEASRRGLSVEEYTLERLFGSGNAPRDQGATRRSALGRYADVPTSSELFASHKAALKAVEDRDRHASQ